MSAFLLAGALAATVLGGPPATSFATPGRCAEPGVGESHSRVGAEEVGMDAAAAADAVDFGMRTGAHTVQIYRHGCLVAGRGPVGEAPMPLASSSKGVASVAVGRAVAMGLFGVDDTLSAFFPEADAAHGAITIRQVLNQTTGLRFSWPSDAAGMVTDQVSQTLNAPIDYPAGSRFQYAQNVLALLPRIIEITAGLDFQEFVDRELMRPLGIDRADWVWLRDRSGNTAVNGGLAMRPSDLARVGRLLVQGGVWNGRQLVDADYIRQGARGTEANGGYGYLWWTNAGDDYRSVNVPTPQHFDHPVWIGSPRDTFVFSGALGQFVAIVPSRDLVLVRLGVPPRIDPTNITGLLTGTTNPDYKELFRRASAAVTDIAPEPADDPYAYPNPVQPLVRTPDDLAKLVDPVNSIAILLGLDPYNLANCALAICHGRTLQEDAERFLVDSATQIAAATPGLRSTG